MESSPRTQVQVPQVQSGSLSRLRERARVRAQELRKTPTDAEALIWSRLRSRQLLGMKFRRQHPIGKYFADFACIECGLVVELDGGQHAAQVAYDTQRTAFIQQAGFEVMRFWNNDVLLQTDAVLEQIMGKLQALTPALSRARERELDSLGTTSEALTPALSRARERELDSLGTTSEALTPTLSRKQEREQETSIH